MILRAVDRGVTSEQIYEANTGRFSTALLLGRGVRIFCHSVVHHLRSRGGTASLTVVLPAG